MRPSPFSFLLFPFMLTACLEEGGSKVIGDTGDVDAVTTTPGGAVVPVNPQPTSDPAKELLYTHPCFGNRTDTLWMDNQDTAFVGCGSTATGYGIYMTADGGKNWTVPNTDLAFGNFRVSSITRSADGLLYVAGIENSGTGYRVVSVDTTTDPMVTKPVFIAGGVSWNNFHVGTFGRTSDGRSVAESLTGHGIVYRNGDAGEFIDGLYWSTDNESHQILDMKVYNDEFYGCGSTISEPYYVYLPNPNDDRSNISMVAIDLPGSGELWGMDVDDGGVIAGGVDQGSNSGVVHYSGNDWYDASQYTTLDVEEVIGAGSTTWVRGVCRNDQDMVAVGEYSSINKGFVIRSTDGGTTWANVTPSTVGTVPPVHRCKIWDDGELVVAGADGFFIRMLP